VDRSRARALEAARDVLGLTVSQLWLAYFGLGGNLLPAAISAALSGDVDLGDHDHDVLVQALNDRFSDLDQNHPLAYADELRPTE
jgi:hypothetical protein